MSLYIHPENQKRMWENISKHPQFQYFDPMYNGTGEKETWFRETIQGFYESNKFKILSVQDLQQLNRETIAYMIRAIKKYEKEYNEQKNTKIQNTKIQNTKIQNTKIQNTKIQNPTIPSTTSSVPSYANSFTSASTPSTTYADFITAGSSATPNGSGSNQTVSREYISEKKQEDMNRHFSERQKEYESMLVRKPLENIDFKMQMVDDKPIGNMDELIRIHTQQRESDIKITAPEAMNSGSKVPEFEDYQSLRQQLKELNDKMNNTIQSMRIEIDDLKRDIRQKNEFPPDSSSNS